MLHNFFNDFRSLVQSPLCFLPIKSLVCLQIWELERYGIRRIVVRYLPQNLLKFYWNTKSFAVRNGYFQRLLLFLLEKLQKMMLVFFTVACFYYLIFTLDNLLNNDFFKKLWFIFLNLLFMMEFIFLYFYLKMSLIIPHKLFYFLQQISFHSILINSSKLYKLK